MTKIKPKVIVFGGKGINCERESVHAWNLAGANAIKVDMNDVLSGEINLKDSQILMFPGGFSYGDDTGSANALAKELKFNQKTLDAILEFAASPNKLVLGICNGFQAMVNFGLIPALEGIHTTPEVSLISNTSVTYEARPSNYLEANPQSPCVFTKGIEVLYCPVAHGEGRFYAPEETLTRLEKENCVVFAYCTKDRMPANLRYPINPNGSLNDIAGICDKSGRLLGMMPHPERAVELTQMYDAQKIFDKLRRQRKQPKRIQYNGRNIATGPGLQIFDNAVKFFE